MKILSINVSLPIEIIHANRKIKTGIFKKPIEGPVYVSVQNLAGDGQADRDNHGGEYKAVYAYSYDHYTYWSEVLNRHDLEFGQFGENLTISGLDESTLGIGDRLQAGEVTFVVTQPRVPCYKLGIKFKDKRIPEKFLQSAMTGCYLKVLKEGHIRKGDIVQILSRDENNISVKDLFKAYYHDENANSIAILKRSLRIEELSPSWRVQIEKRLGNQVLPGHHSD